MCTKIVVWWRWKDNVYGDVSSVEIHDVSEQFTFVRTDEKKKHKIFFVFLQQTKFNEKQKLQKRNVEYQI